LKLLNNLTVPQIAELSKAYISQVKSGSRPPSKKIIKILAEYYAKTRDGKREADSGRAIQLFLNSRREGISEGTIDFYEKYLTKALPVLGLTPSARKPSKYLDSLSCSTGGKHAYFRAIDPDALQQMAFPLDSVPTVSPEIQGCNGSGLPVHHVPKVDFGLIYASAKRIWLG
jgi:hypothetical protein